MAYARPPNAPQLPSCPLEALEPRENEYVGLLDLYGLPALGGIAGVAMPFIANFYQRKPMYTGIWKPILLAPLLLYAGFWARDLRTEILDDKDEVLRQYIKLHPQDFPPYERKLIKHTFQPWDPVR